MKRWQDVYDFWIGPKPNPDIWFKKDPTLDQKIRDKFGAWLENFDITEYEEWKSEPRGLLSLVILLDQFPRNIYRDSAKSFAFDTDALELAKEALERGFDDQFTSQENMFLVLPFEHSEDITDQKEGVRLAQNMVEVAKPEDKKFAQGIVDFAQKHHDIIKRFGRFPHRNKALSRTSTPEEEAFLKTPGSSF